jgi:hypothetical protein
MAEYMNRVKALLLEQSRNFMELDTICFPPIDFKDVSVWVCVLLLLWSLLFLFALPSLQGPAPALTFSDRH